MQIQVDKCITFRIKMFPTCSLQFQPKLFINTLKSYRLSKMVRPSNTLAVSSTLIWVTRIIRKVLNPAIMHVHPKNKLLLYHRHALSKLSWHFTVTDLGKTWISENLDNIVSKYIRQWLSFPCLPL